MSDVAARFTVDPQNPIETSFELNVNNNDHATLINRDMSDQHPMSAITGLEAALEGKQDTLTAGENIQIEDGVISATDTTYTAGTGISIENGVISNTQTSAEWGNITGLLSAQTDLQNALNAKEDVISDLSDIRSGAALGATSLQPNDNITELNNNAGYITGISGTDVVNALGYTPYSASNPNGYTSNVGTVTSVNNTSPDSSGNVSISIPTVNSGILTIQKNGSSVATFSANNSSNVTADISVPTDTSDLTNGAEFITSSALNGYATTSYVDTGLEGKQNNLSQTQMDAVNSGATSTNIGQIATNTSDISTINGLIPSQATTSNQLADKAFVNSSIATNTANFIGTFANVPALEAYSGTVTNNDYAFVVNSVITDNGDDWATFAALDAYDKTLLTNFDYAWVINGSNFDLYRFDILDQEWDLRVSDTPKASVTLNTAYNRYKATLNGTTSWDYEYTLNNSSFTASQWAAINSGITSGDVYLIATALQPNDNISNLNNDSGYITGITSSDVTTALGYTPYDSSNPNGYTSNVGTVTSVNNVSPVNGNVTLSIPAAQVNSDWNAVSGVAEILNKPSLATVATSGAYSDLSGTPTIPTVNNATLTITQGGVSKGTFTANASSDVTIALDAGSSYTAGTGIDITSNVISVTSPTLVNNTTNGLSILGTSSNQYNSTSIGLYSNASGMGSVAISDSYGIASASGLYGTCVGGDSSATGIASTAFGSHAKATANYAIQLGYGTNSEANSFYVSTSTSNNWKMLGSDGLIPDARISSNIARASDIPSITEYTANEVETLWESL